MKLILKYKKEILLSVFIGILYFSSRLYNIMSLPIFTDEAIYVRWAQIARFDASWRFISLTDGKQPSFIWLVMIVMRFVQDPLLAGRLVSVAVGFITVIGLYMVGRELFKDKRVGVVSSLLYCIYPFGLVYDRMALYDSLVGAIMVWILYLEILLIRKVRLDLSLILGMVIGGGMLTKTNTFFSLPFLAASTILFDWKKKEWRILFLKWAGLACLSGLLGYLFYSILRLSPYFHIINDKNAVFVYPFREWLGHPFLYFLSNLRGLFDWLTVYVSWPLFMLVFASFLIPDNFKLRFTKLSILSFVVLSILGLIMLFFSENFIYLSALASFVSLLSCILLAFFKNKSYFFEKILLIVWFLVPFVYLAFFGKTIYPRFILFMTLPLLILVAYSLVKLIQNISPKKVSILVFSIFLIFPLYADYFILTNIAHAPIPGLDLDQYINAWPAGGGIKEIITFLRIQSNKGKIYVATEGTFGSLPTYAVEIYLGDDKNVEKRGIWPTPAVIPQDLFKKAQKIPVYYIQYQTKTKPNWPLRLIASYQKGAGTSFTYLYQVIP